MYIMTSLVDKTAIDDIDAAAIVCLGLDLGEDNSCILPGELSKLLKEMRLSNRKTQINSIDAAAIVLH